MGASPVGFHNAPFGTTGGRRCVKHGVAGEGLQAFRGVGKAFVFQSFGGGDSVRVALRSFHCLKGHQLPAEPTGYPMDSPENSSHRFNEMPLALPVRRNPNGLNSVPGSGTT
jgi:hypothetical protein